MESEEKFQERLHKLSKASPEKKRKRLKTIEEREDRFVNNVKWRMRDRLERDRSKPLEE